MTELSEKDREALRKVREETDYWTSRRRRREVSEKQKGLEEFQ
jgi:hypothetical protein